MNDTIVAISTAVSNEAISIIRLSGEEAIKIANKNFKGKNLEEAKTHTINYGYIVDNNEIIDEVLVSVMKAPKTYTLEDIVEINCHGGIITTNKILEIMLTNGARLAQPGEFTKRAFLNGRIDLVKSEAISDIINSKTNEARKVAISSLQGNLSNLIKKFRNNLRNLLSQIEVNIDYPEYYDIEVVTMEKIKEQINKMKKDLKILINESNQILPIKNGIKTTIIGKPNVGKSSLLNTLINEEKAIVTDIPGTTRDIVEGQLIIDGLLLNLIDTAGIRETNDVVEKIGVEKSLKSIDNAELIILVLNNNEKITEEELNLIEETKDKNIITVINKIDLETKLQLPKNLKNVIKISIKNNTGIEKIKEKIKEIYKLKQIKSKDYTYLSNARQISLAKQAMEKLNEAEISFQNNMPIDIIGVDLQEAFSLLGDIIGENSTEDIIDNLFKNFCVGK